MTINNYNFWKKTINFKVRKSNNTKSNKTNHGNKEKYISWNKPPPGYYKLNFDGSFKNGNANIGSIIRNNKGEIIDIYNLQTNEGSALLVEARALLEGIIRASGRGITNHMIEGDGLTIINAIKDIWKPPWEIQSMIEDMKIILQSFNSVEIYHCYREGNQAADFLARNNCNLSCNLSEP